MTLRFRAAISLCEIHDFQFVVSVQFTSYKKYMSRVMTCIPTFTAVWKCRIGDPRFSFLCGKNVNSVAVILNAVVVIGDGHQLLFSPGSLLRSYHIYHNLEAHTSRDRLRLH